MIQSFLGILVFILISRTLSENKRAISYRTILIGVGVQFLLAVLILKIPFISEPFIYLNKIVSLLQNVTDRATQFMFGYLAGGKAPFEVIDENSNFIITFRVLPLILVVSSLSAVFYSMGILPLIIRIFSILLKKIFKSLSGALAFGSSASLFFGTIETPLLIRPYLQRMTRAELFCLITCSMATISGSVMILYSSVLSGVIENPLSHLLTASLISIPAAVLVSLTMIPITEKNDLEFMKNQTDSILSSFIQGIHEGLQMVLGICATIICFFALIYLINNVLESIHQGLTIQSMLAIPLRPILWLTGIPWNEISAASEIYSIKIILNEFVAFLELKTHISDFSEASRISLSYSLCGFANLGSVGIITGGLITLIPERKVEITRLVLKSLISGNIATLMTGAVISIVSRIF